MQSEIYFESTCGRHGSRTDGDVIGHVSEWKGVPDWSGLMKLIKRCQGILQGIAVCSVMS